MAVGTAQLDGYFKEVYGDLEDAVPSWAEIQKRIPFRQQDRLGDSYHFPVILRRSHGVTFAGTTSGGTAFTLNDPVSLQSKDASVAGTELVIQEDVAYSVLNRAAQAGPAAFGDSMDEIVYGLRESAQFYLEMALLYGGTNIGTISANSGTGTTQTLTISAATWASGIWSQMEGAKVDLYTAAGTKVNAGAVTVSTVLADSRQLICSGTAAVMAAATTGVVFRPFGSTSELFSGLDKITTNTATLFGIDAGTYTLWKANTHTAGSAKLTMAKLQAALSKAVGRGLNEDVVVFMSHYTWTDFNDDLSALRRYAKETKAEMTLGTTSIKFYGVSGGSMELVPHPMVKAGECYVIPVSRCRRIGSTDTTSRLQGVDGQENSFYQELESKAGIRLRCYWDQALISTQPAKLVKISSIVNESGP